MRRLFPWIALATFAAFACRAAVVYKWTDSDGVVHYSDQPVPGAEKIVIAGQSSLGTGASTKAGAQQAAAKKPQVPALGYSQFSIGAPTPEQTFFGDEPIAVRLDLVPALKEGQTLTWHLGGQDLSGDTNATSFTLPHLDRGTYSISATLSDPQSGTSQSTESVTFYVHQPSLLSPEHKH
jgi:uncharacterized protein DUF4124